MHDNPQDILGQKTNEVHPQLYEQLPGEYQGGVINMVEL